MYGAQWRTWRTADGGHVDQIQRALDLLRKDPNSRRNIVSAWNVGELDQMALAPCHAMFQFYVANGRLSCQLYQRSADVFLGVPFNIASYALLIHMLAQQTDLAPGELVWTGGDCHLYLNHLEQVELQLARVPLPLPKLVIKRRPPSLFDYRFEDFELVGYQAHARDQGADRGVSALRALGDDLDAQRLLAARRSHCRPLWSESRRLEPRGTCGRRNWRHPFCQRRRVRPF